MEKWEETRRQPGESDGGVIEGEGGGDGSEGGDGGDEGEDDAG